MIAVYLKKIFDYSWFKYNIYICSSWCFETKKHHGGTTFVEKSIQDMLEYAVMILQGSSRT